MAKMAVAMTKFHCTCESAPAVMLRMPMTMGYIRSSVLMSKGQRYWFQP